MCGEYWTYFYVDDPGYAVRKNTTTASSLDDIASSKVYKYNDDSTKVGVLTECHATGVTTTNLTFVNDCTGKQGTSSSRCGQSVSVFWRKDCVVYPVWYQLMDPGNIGMICLAVAMVTWGGLRVQNTVAQQLQQEMGDDSEISIKKAIAFVVASSISLLLIFYFLKAMSVLLTICFCFVSTIAIAMVVYSVLYPLSCGVWLHQTRMTLPYWGEVNMLEGGSFMTAVATTVVWVVTRHWIANNILGMSICLYMMTVLRLSSIKVAAVLLTLLFFYDIFWVFYSTPIFGGNVMVTAAKGLDLPIKLLLPRGVATPCYEPSFTMLGLGDIALPGLLGVFTRRFDLANPFNKVGYFHIFVLGYTVGMCTCFVVLSVFKAAQPALLYLVPCTLGSIMLIGLQRGDLKALWDGLQRSASSDQDESSNHDGESKNHDHQNVDVLEEVETAPMLSSSESKPDDKTSEQDFNTDGSELQDFKSTPENRGM